MTQKDLAEILNVTPQAISKWERNKSYPDLDTLVKLSTYFQVSTDSILGNAKRSFFDSLFSKKRGRNYMEKEMSHLTNQSTENQPEKVIIIFSITASFISDAGFQTQRLAVKMNQIAKERDVAIIIELYSSNKVAEKGKQADVILLTPEFAYAQEKIQKTFPEKKVKAISKKDYGLLNAEKILMDSLN
ncbi:helix-turn-helix domain-containing protein [Enterococcus crotali]|uniref:helix-turn-helix domain-containing protein n=1 Tax=Enterococcus crotali TaxID=1453587 RepID=UPI000B1CD6C3